MHYRPDTALVGTVEFDHADIFRDLEHVKTVFRWFTNIVPSRGLLVRHEDCDVTREVTSAALCRIEGYGADSGRWRVMGLSDRGEDGTAFRILRDREPFGGEVVLRLGGEHNVRNALAVTAAAHEQGLDAETIVAGLSTFRGVRRRLEVRGEVAGVTVVDDFAHHPTAIAETLRAVARRFPGRKIWAVFEPRSWSMRRNVFQDRLPGAFAGADEVVLARVFGAEELPPSERLDPERLVRDLAAAGRRARFLEDAEAIVEDLVGRCVPGDVIAVMSNGGFDGLHDKLLEALAGRRP
jgi:UDP-N-acetylmuramate: L-alanyl-gamma-D-glutamyl-meso-diaminopimelate ligase